MAAPQKPWKAEYAKSARSSCKTCKSPIGMEVFRLGKMVQSRQFDGFIPMWHHASCILKKPKQIMSIEDVGGLDALRWEDQQKLRKYMESTELSNATAVPAVGVIEISKASRATCKSCNQKISKGEVRISTKSEGRGAKNSAWHHAHCFVKSFPSISVEKLDGWDSLSETDKAAVHGLVKDLGKSGLEEEIPDGTDLLKQPTAKKGTKRKGEYRDNSKSKAVKAKGDVSMSGALSEMASAASGDQPKKESDLGSKLELQSKKIWNLKDGLKKHATAAELRAMLEVNGQDSTGSEIDLRDRCADGMLFGALDCCPVCSGCLRYSGGIYHCHGYLSEWSKCSYSTAEPIRKKGKWMIPEGTSNEYLCKWFKSQKDKKPVRILPPTSQGPHSQIQATDSFPHSANTDNLGDLKVAFVGLPQESIEEWKGKIGRSGGAVHVKIKKDTNCVVVSGVMDDNAELRKARRLKLPIVREDYLTDSFTKKKKLPFDQYKIEGIGEASSMATIKVKGRSSVHESSGLQDTGHILENGNSIYNTTMNMSDLSTGVNSYYILQIIQEDKGSDCYVFRKWGRVGNDKIGGSKLEEMLKSDAIEEFKRLFFEKTGNPWEAWEQKQNFQKQPGRFFPLDIDYGVDKQISKKKNPNDSITQLARPLAELMKMLFNVETYRAAMMEFEINMAEMPLGKLSKTNIQKGYQALTEIQNVLKNNDYDFSVKENLIVDASNRFFTLIPSIHPHVIRDEESFKSKLKMLDALQDIEVASRLVGFDSDNDDTLDDKYKKLNCEISPLPHDCEDYHLIEKYLLTTHAPTHKDWTLGLEEVFSLEREGELDKFAPYRQKLKNRMLLWHGSRLTNFVGIISQGLRIAPPEAPATGYMFGKGIYFADLVSKSAQYCYTTKNDPVGFLLLSEVALGEVHELKNATYMDKPPKGKHSTKGIGKTKPEESEFVVWRDGVVVPCGKPVPSNVKSSELMYNEYIVYDTAQVKMQYLLKVRFHHKRGAAC